MNTFYPHFEPRWNNKNRFIRPLENIKLTKYETMVFKDLNIRAQRQ